MLKMTYGLLYNSRVCCRPFSIISQIKDMSSSNVEANLQKTNLNEELEGNSNSTEVSSSSLQFRTLKPKNRMVAAAFASLTKEPVKKDVEINTPHTDRKIFGASNVDELLSISNGEGISRRLALKIVSVLAEWTSSQKIKLSDFENDYRFIKLCKVLTKFQKPERYEASKSEDLSTVLGVTADEEAAKLIQTITLSQMVKVMTTLSIKKRRSTLLLRTLAYNISGNPDKLNLKQASDLLYSMSVLSFIDENLLSKISLDICHEMDNKSDVTKSSVIGSILKSLGYLRYKNLNLLDSLCNWLMENCDTCRSQDIFTLFITLANLNYLPPDYEKLLQVFSPYLTELEAGNSNIWLDYIWSKVLLNIATQEEVSHVLSANFLNSLTSSNKTSISTNLKILNINGAADCLIDGYAGNKLPDDSLFREAVLPNRKEKTELVNSIVNSLKNLMNSEKYLKMDTNSGYGFSISVECILDEKFSPIEINSMETNGVRIAIQPLAYHDMTNGRIEPSGINVFAEKILKTKGYEVLMVPYNEFNPQTKLISRVQYLEKNLKEIVKNSESNRKLFL